MYKRVLCLVSSLSFAVTACFGSFGCISAYAASPLDAAQVIDQFAEDVNTAHDRVTQAVREDFENGNVDATSALGQQYLLAIALQTAAVNNPQVSAAIQLAKAYETGQAEAQDWIDWYNSNQTLTISASHLASGYYKLSYNGALRMCNVYTFPDWSSSNFGSTFISADDYSYSVVTDNPSTCECRCYNDNYTGTLFYEFQLRIRATNMYPETHISLQGSGIGASITDWMGFANGSGSSSRNISFRGTDRGALYIPVYSSMNPLYGFPDPLFACGVYSDIPSAEVDTSTVYDYYNDTILPLVKQECPDVPDNYYYFYGNEYNSAQDPTEPPTTTPMPDIVLPPFGELETEVSSYYVTDESGETVTDESGEPITETTNIPVTIASTDSEGVWKFRIPTLPNMSIPETDTLNTNLPTKYIRLTGSLFDAVYDVLDASGILGVLPFLITMAVIVYIVYKVGG